MQKVRLRVRELFLAIASFPSRNVRGSDLSEQILSDAAASARKNFRDFANVRFADD
jgi:hypothetical protein